MLITLSFHIGCYMRDFISLSMLLHIKSFLNIKMQHDIQFKKCLFAIILVIFSNILNIECLYARVKIGTDTYCRFCGHSSGCQLCAHTYNKEKSFYIDESENLTPDSKRSNNYLHISLDGISFGKKKSEETGDEDDENIEENIDEEESMSTVENEDLEGDIEEESEDDVDDIDDLSEDESEEDNDTETQEDSNDGNDSEDEILDEEQQETQNPEESDTLDNPNGDLDAAPKSTDDLTMPDNTTDMDATLQSADSLSADSSGDISATGTDNYQEIVQDVIEYFKELGVLDESKMSQLSRGLKNGICMSCRTNGLVHIIPGKRMYNICSNCFERMVDGFISRGSGYTSPNNLGGGAAGMYSGINGNSYSNTQGITNGNSFNSGGNQYVNGQGMNGMAGQNNTPDAASGIVGAALSSIPGMNGQLESALSSGISSLLHKDNVDSGANSTSGTTMPVMGMVDANGLPIATTTPNSTVPVAGQPTTVAGSTASATSGNQMVLNALGQLVPMSSLAGTSAPYGYVKNTDGSFSPATSEAQGLAAGTAANNTPTSKLDSTLSKVSTSVNQAVSTANTIATAATPIAGLASNLATAVSSLKTAKSAQNSSTTSTNSQTSQATSSEQTTPTKEKTLKQRGSNSSSSTSTKTTSTSKKKMKKSRS